MCSRNESNCYWNILVPTNMLEWMSSIHNSHMGGYTFSICIHKFVSRGICETQCPTHSRYRLKEFGEPPVRSGGNWASLTCWPNNTWTFSCYDTLMWFWYNWIYVIFVPQVLVYRRYLYYKFFIIKNVGSLQV